MFQFAWEYWSEIFIHMQATHDFGAFIIDARETAHCISFFPVGPVPLHFRTPFHSIWACVEGWPEGFTWGPVDGLKGLESVLPEFGCEGGCMPGIGALGVARFFWSIIFCICTEMACGFAGGIAGGRVGVVEGNDAALIVLACWAWGGVVSRLATGDSWPAKELFERLLGWTASDLLLDLNQNWKRICHIRGGWATSGSCLNLASIKVFILLWNSIFTEMSCVILSMASEFCDCLAVSRSTRSFWIYASTCASFWYASAAVMWAGKRTIEARFVVFEGAVCAPGGAGWACPPVIVCDGCLRGWGWIVAWDLDWEGVALWGCDCGGVAKVFGVVFGDSVLPCSRGLLLSGVRSTVAAVSLGLFVCDPIDLVKGRKTTLFVLRTFRFEANYRSSEEMILGLKLEPRLRGSDISIHLRIEIR